MPIFVLQVIFYSGIDRWFTLDTYYEECRFSYFQCVFYKYVNGKPLSTLALYFEEAMMERHHNPTCFALRDRHIKCWSESKSKYLPPLAVTSQRRYFYRFHKRLAEQIPHTAPEQDDVFKKAHRSYARMFIGAPQGIKSNIWKSLVAKPNRSRPQEPPQSANVPEPSKFVVTDEKFARLIHGFEFDKSMEFLAKLDDVFLAFNLKDTEQKLLESKGELPAKPGRPTTQGNTVKLGGKDLVATVADYEDVFDHFVKAHRLFIQAKSQIDADEWDLDPNTRVSIDAALGKGCHGTQAL
ncbi:hypothetical protein EJ08DRAFT_652259 [Tothia fuscella]|uniref:Uncharacterized protein n=1 Tax=Tothia fuscella TaxID=1048955 RepID=A0A9P4TV48_9PEZI|nr:hypothetical protein EJ08DRAFT_652259 [Tothia fuscella]